MDKAKIEEMEKDAEKNAQWLTEARATVANDKGMSENSDEELDTDAFQEYIQLHSEEKDYEYLVRGAKLNCRCGSHIRMMNLPVGHGVYIGENPMVHEYDCVQGINREGNISWFGVCTAERSYELPGDDVCYQLTPDNNVKGLEGETEPGKKCQPHIVGVWQDVCDKTKIVDKWDGDIEGEEELCSLTTGSFLVCNYGGIIEPVTSGQEYVMTEKDLGLDENGKSKDGNIDNEKEWEEIQGRRENKNAECGEADCSLAHERYRSGDNADHGNIHGTNYCTVVFQYKDGKIIDEQLVKKGDAAIAPTELEEREGFKFSWDKEFTNIFEDTTITAMYELVDVTNKEAVQRYIWDFFIEKGFSEYMVAGILGNIYAECKFNCYDSTGIYYGLFQLSTEDRLKPMDSWIALQPDSSKWTEVQKQCEFAYYEMNNLSDGWINVNFHVTINKIELEGYEPIDPIEIKKQATKENFRNSDSPTEAAMIFAAAYERCPKSVGGEYLIEKIGGVTYYIEYQLQQDRCEYAELYYRKFSGE